MNIIVQTSEGNTVFRPDTSWNRKSEDIYLPDFVKELGWSPAVYARISRPGKCILPRFAQRYYDAVGAGILFYPSTGIESGSGEAYAQSLLFDHCTVLPSDTLDKLAAGSRITIRGNGQELFSTQDWSLSLLDEAIANISRFSLVRAGDLVAVEMTDACNFNDDAITVEVGGKTMISLRIIRNTEE